MFLFNILCSCSTYYFLVQHIMFYSTSYVLVQHLMFLFNILCSYSTSYVLIQNLMFLFDILCSCSTSYVLVQDAMFLFNIFQKWCFRGRFPRITSNTALDEIKLQTFWMSWSNGIASTGKGDQVGRNMYMTY